MKQCPPSPHPPPPPLPAPPAPPFFSSSLLLRLMQINTKTGLGRARAKFAYKAMCSDELSFDRGTEIAILSTKDMDPGWWKGSLPTGQVFTSLVYFIIIDGINAQLLCA